LVPIDALRHAVLVTTTCVGVVTIVPGVLVVRPRFIDGRADTLPIFIINYIQDDL